MVGFGLVDTRVTLTFSGTGTVVSDATTQALTGTNIPPVTMPNGFTYNLQELAFFSWFFGAPTIGLNGWFSNNGTFLTDAGPPCTN